MGLPTNRTGSTPPRRGANLVEFALTLPFFLLMFLGVLDYGWLYANQSGINAAASLACREGSMVDALFNSPIDTAKTELASRSAAFCSGSCTIDVQPRYTVPDRALECTIEMPYEGLTGFVPMPNRLQANAIYRLEWQRQGSLE